MLITTKDQHMYSSLSNSKCYMNEMEISVYENNKNNFKLNMETPRVYEGLLER